MKKYLFIVGVMAFIPISVSAATFVSGQAYTHPDTDVMKDNLYAVGGSVNIVGKVLGDVMVAGGNVFIVGDSAEDVTVVGGSIYTTGPVGDDLRMVGGNVNIGSTVDGEIVAVGGQVQFMSNASASGVWLVGGMLNLEGDVSGDVWMAGDEIHISGTVLGDVEVRAKNKLIIDESAVVKGSLKYFAPQEADIASDAQIGSVEYTPWNPGKGQASIPASWFVAIFGGLWFIKMLMIMVAGLVLLWVMNSFVGETTERMLNGFGKELLRGFIIAVVIPVAAILLFISFLGIPLGLLALVVCGLLFVAGSIMAPIVAGSWIIKVARKQKSYEVTWASVIVGGIVLSIVKLIPVIGWVVGAILFLAALGSIAYVGYHRLHASR